MTPRFVDIHCHILPGIDDGAADPEVAMSMARMATEDQISTIIATPHQLGNFASNTAQAIRHQVAAFQQRLAEANLPLAILPGADVRIETDLVRRLRDDEVLTLADQGRHVLLELPHELYFPLEPLLKQLSATGLVGILSHPERNQGILRQPDLLAPLVDAGCLLQVTAGSLTGSFGPRIAQFSQWILSEGLAHFLATDAHGARSRRPRLRRAFRLAAELVGEDHAVTLCFENPRRVAAGEAVQPGRLHGGRLRRFPSFWRRKAG